MKVQNITNIDKFFEVVDSCKGKVELVTGEGDRLNLKSKLSQYVSLANIFSGGEIPYLQTMAYQDASYLRLRTLQIGYTLPQKLANKLRCSKLRIYATGTNLLTFTNVWSYSPEVLGNSYPESQQYVLGVNLSF